VDSSLSSATLRSGLGTGHLGFPPGYGTWGAISHSTGKYLFHTLLPLFLDMCCPETMQKPAIACATLRRILCFSWFLAVSQAVSLVRDVNKKCSGLPTLSAFRRWCSAVANDNLCPSKSSTVISLTDGIVDWELGDDCPRLFCRFHRGVVLREEGCRAVRGSVKHTGRQITDTVDLSAHASLPLI
jgi:hypothetical protein